MISALLLGSALLAASPDDPALASDLADYQATEAKIGRDSGAHLKLALWCDAHGLGAERLKHLALAVLIDPRNSAARGLLGLVAYRGHWLRPEVVSERVGADADLAARLAEYNARRAGLDETADAHWKLALWCDQNGLKAEARAHLAAVVRLDPSRADAWKRLGCKRHHGRWMTEAEIAAEKDEAEAQKKANQHWKPLLTRWRGWLGDKDRREDAERALAEVTDPHAVPSIWAVFIEGGGGGRGQARAVQLLGQIDAPRASRALAMLAVFSDSAEVRRAATETLRGRDRREYLSSLIALLRQRLKYEVRPVGGPGSPGALFVEGRKFNVQRLYAPPPMPNIPLFPGETITYDAYGLPVISRMVGLVNETVDIQPASQNLSPSATGPLPTIRGRDLMQRFGRNRLVDVTTVPLAQSVTIPIGRIALQYQAAAASSARQLQSDLAAVEAFNTDVKESNERVVGVLHDLTGQDLGEDQQAWISWWTDQQGYVYRPTTDAPKPTIVQDVPPAYQPQAVPLGFTQAQSGPATTSLARTSSHSCFRAGTPVRTLAGPRPIETVQLGDRVLTQDVKTGVLSYQPVLAVFHNRPDATLRIDLGGELIVATTIHRFWKAGQGWVMARDLKPGDVLRNLGGTARVRSVESDQVQPVFNLQVAEGSSFFVGEAGTLVHDNSLVEPVTAPFDAPPELASLDSSAK